MKIIYYFAIGFVLASAGVSQRAFAQTYDRTYARSLILPGGGTDAIDNLTITLHSSTTGGITWTLPATNINGLFLNDGAGNISWATTLPSGLTIPSPIFTGTITLPAGTAAPSIGTTNVTTGTFYPAMVNSSATSAGIAPDVSAGVSFNAATDALTLGVAGPSGGTTGSLVLANSGNSNLTTIIVPSGAPAITYTLPSTSPSNGQFLQSTSNGGLSWVSSTGGAGGTSLFSGQAHPKFGGNAATYTFPYGYVHDEGANQNAANVASLDVALINESGTLKNLTVTTDGTNLSSGTATLSLYDVTAGASTGISVNLTGSTTTATDATHTYTVPSGHLLTLQYSGSGSPPGFQAAWAYQFSGSLGSGGMTNPMSTTGDIIYSTDNSGDAARLGIGGSNTVLTGGTTPSYQTLATNSSLLGNGIGTSFGINLTNANTWTGVQTHSSTASANAPLVATNTAATSSIQYGATIASTGSSTGLGNVGLQVDASGNTAVGGYNVALYAHTGTVNIQGLTPSDVVMTDANRNLISAGTATTVPAHDFLLGPIGSSNGAATFRAIDSSDISSATAAKIAAKLAATPGSGVANVATAVTGVVSINSTGATILAGDSIHIPANATISFQFIMIDSQNYGGSNAAGMNPGDGIKFGLTWPSGATVWAEAVGTEDNAANGHEHAEHLRTSGTLTTNNFLDQQNTPPSANDAATGTIQIIGTIVNGSTAGTLQVVWGTSNTATIGYIFPYAQITAYTH